MANEWRAAHKSKMTMKKEGCRFGFYFQSQGALDRGTSGQSEPTKKKRKEKVRIIWGWQHMHIEPLSFTSTKCHVLQAKRGKEVPRDTESMSPVWKERPTIGILIPPSNRYETCHRRITG